MAKNGGINVFQARIYVTLKNGILDPQGKAVKGGLANMGYQGVADVRVGKFLVLTLDCPDRPQAEQSVREMCDRLLANPVIEDYTFEVQEASK
jgi:phosphoribosylformylglycinamidine synthase